MKIRGYASTPDKDQGKDVVVRNAFTHSLQTRGISGARGIKLLHNHNRDSILGRITRLTEDSGGLYMEAEVDEELTLGKEVAQQIRNQKSLGFSIGYAIYEKTNISYDEDTDTFFLDGLDLKEVSVVTFAMNENCKIASYSE